MPERMLKRTIVAFVLLLSLSGAAAQEEGEEEARPPSKYRIVRVHLPSGPSGPQAAVTHGYYIVNFGSREGVLRGSIFDVYSKGVLMGVVRVDQVWRDSTSVSLVELVHKADAESLNPLESGYYLEPKFVLLETVQFDKGEPSLSPAMHERLRYVARFIRAYPDFPLVIEGHTDNSGKKEKNQKLSEARAERIKNFLSEVHRLPVTQMHVKGYGQADPIASNASEEGRRQNRRVDIILMDERPE